MIQIVDQLKLEGLLLVLNNFLNFQFNYKNKYPINLNKIVNLVDPIFLLIKNFFKKFIFIIYF